MAGLANRIKPEESQRVNKFTKRQLVLILNLIPSKSRADKQNVTLSLSADDTHFCLFFLLLSKAKAKIQFGTKFRPGETAQPDINNLIQTVSGCRLESGPVTTAIIGQRQISALLRSQMMFTAVV